MENTIFDVSSELELPYWWVQSVAVEYLNCREFAAVNEIWAFNFDLISKKELLEAVETKKIVVSSPIIQYPTLNSETLFKSLENYLLGITSDDEGVIVEGPIPRDNFPDKVEFLDFIDPQLSFSDYFQVYDGGRFWQWKIAEQIPVKSEHRTEWVSSEIDLTPINHMDVELGKIKKSMVKPGKPGYKEFKLEVEDYYQKLGEIREGILLKLWDFHQKKRLNWVD